MEKSSHDPYKYLYVNQIDDGDFFEDTAKKVDNSSPKGYTVLLQSGWSMWIDRTGIVPEVGDVIRLYGRGFGYPVRGIAIEGVVVRYLTQEEYLENERIEREKKAFKERQQEAAEREERRKGVFSSLPKYFQERITDARKRDPTFSWEREKECLFVFEQATTLAQAMGSSIALDSWWNMSHETKRSSRFLSKGHTVLTLTMTYQAAKEYIAYWETQWKVQSCYDLAKKITP